MHDAIDTASRARLHFRVLCLLTVVALLVFLGIFLSKNTVPFAARQLASDVGLLAGGLAAAVSCGLLIKSTSGNRRRAWTFLSLAGLAAAIGNGWVLIAHLNHSSKTLTSYGDVGFAAALLLGLVALLLFPAVKRRGLDLTRIVFDGIVVGGSLLSIVGLTIFPQLLRQADNAGNSPVLNLLTTLADVVIATLAAMLIVRGARADRTVLLLLGSGGILFAASELARAALSSRNHFNFGGPVDIGWIAGYAAFALAARCPDPPSEPNTGPAEVSVADATWTPPQVSSSLTFGAFLIAALLRVIRLPETGSSALNSAIWIAVLLAVTIRQALLIIDNESLRRDLERRVADRTSDLQSLTRTSQTMLDSVGDGIYGVDPTGRITFANPSTVKMLEFTESDLIGAQAHDLFHAPAVDGTQFPYPNCYIAEAIRQGSVTTAEEDIYRRHDGRLIPVEVTASPLIRDSAVEGAVVVFRDITQRREVDKMKSEFVSVVSHELRTPMTSIRGSLGLLSAGALGELSPAAARMVKIALESSERLTRLINDILDIERIETGTMPMELARTRCADVIKTAVDQVHSIAVEAGVQLSITEANGWVLADADRIVQALVNLLGNAIKFSDPHSVVELETSVDATFVTFRVRDQGRGIPADKLAAVFRRFEQVDSSDARDKGGSGLGLAISRSIVEVHGGEISVESTFGQGSIFSFTIPVAPADMPPTGGHHSDHPTILVCDQDPMFVEALSTLIRRRDYRVMTATDGQSAVKIAGDQQPEALVMDLMIESNGGGAVVSALRSDRRTQHLPIMVISGPAAGADLPTRADSHDRPVGPNDDPARTIRISIADEAIIGDVVLVADDEPTATMIRVLLERRGAHVSHARGHHEAVQLMAEIEPRVLIIDRQRTDEIGQSVLEAVEADERLSRLEMVVYGVSAAPGRDAALGSHTAVLLNRIPSTGRLLASRLPIDDHQGPASLERRVLGLIDEVTGQHGRSLDKTEQLTSSNQEKD